jgi:hypothetical protein
MSRLLKAVAAIAIFAFVTGFTAHAAPLTAGQTFAAPGEADPTGGTVIANSGAVAFSGSPGPTAFSGTLTSKVIQNDPSNPLGGLTFTFQLTNSNTSLSSLSRLTTDDFTGFLTDVSYQTPAAGTAPTSVDRNTAAVVGWTYAIIGNGQVNPGSSSALMVVQTNAQGFGNVTANILGGTGATAASFGPVPEPASIAFLSLGGLVLRRRRA